MTKNVGMFLLGAWLILTGLIGLVHLNFSGLEPLMASPGSGGRPAPHCG